MCGDHGKKVDLVKTFEQLESKFGIKKVLVEGGGEINWSIIKNNLFDVLIVTVSPIIIGGRNTITLVEGKGYNLIKNCPKLKLFKISKRDDGEITMYYNNVRIKSEKI